jgi:hypothetical protein
MQDSLAIALAWPETLCKQAGAWYDKPANWLGVCENNYYKVGHSAIVLINPKNHNCEYFDFGRYHAPYDYGRVRNEITDHELKIKIKAALTKEFELINYQDIIDEIQLNSASHGDGQLYAGLVKINYEKAIHRAKSMQNEGVIKYGPFVLKGTNCSRFVRSVLFNSVKSSLLKFKLTFTRTLSPTPIGVVKNLKNQKRANYKTSKETSENNIESCKVIPS